MGKGAIAKGLVIRFWDFKEALVAGAGVGMIIDPRPQLFRQRLSHKIHATMLIDCDSLSLLVLGSCCFSKKERVA